MTKDTFIYNECTNCGHLTEIWFNSRNEKFSNFLVDKNYFECEKCKYLDYLDGYYKEMYAISTRPERKGKAND